MCHPSGFASDIHRMLDVNNNSQQRIINLDGICYEKGGNQQNAELSSADDYLQNNFSGEKVICFPPAAAFDQPLQEIHDKLKAYYERQGGRYVILTNYSSKKHFDYLEQCPHSIGINLPQDDLNRILVFDGELHTIMNIRITSSTTLEDIQETYRCTHEDLKALFVLHADLIQSCNVRLMAAIAVINLNRQSTNSFPCKQCLSITLTKDDLADNESFFKRWDEVNYR